MFSVYGWFFPIVSTYAVHFQNAWFDIATELKYTLDMNNVVGSLTQRIAGSSSCACVPVNPGERAAQAARYSSEPGT